MNYLISILFSFFIASSSWAQISENIQLLDVKTIDGSARYSGSSGYVDDQGREYGLVGARIGLGAYLIESDTLKFIDLVPGPQSNWREIAVLGDHAYITTEGSGFGQGLQVVDLSHLPDSLELIATYDNDFTRGHMVQVDYFNPQDPYVYVAGVTPGGGVRILDASNPEQLTNVGIYEPYYIHDVHVRGNTMYAAAIYNGTVDIVDISDKSNPQLITQLTYPNPFTHSAFTDATGDILFVTDEIDGTPMRVWDLTDLNNPEEIAQYSGGLESLVHNPYVVGDFCYISHNTEGLRVVDVVDPSVPIEVGFYDTWDGPSGGFSGLWSAWPFLPSGRLLGGDRFGGLYLWSFDNIYAGRIYGQVLDSISQAPIINAQIELGTSWQSQSDLFGNYACGAQAGQYSLTVSATGYISKSIDLELNAMDSLTEVFELLPISTSLNQISSLNFNIGPNPTSGELMIQSDLSGPINLEIYNLGGQLMQSERIEFNAYKQLDISNLPEGVYMITINKDGYQPFSSKIVVTK